MFKKVLFFLLLFLVGTVLAWTPPSDINLQNYYNITGGADASFIGNITASWFKGIFNFIIGKTSTNYLSFNGTQLDFDESFLNATIDARAVTSESDPYWTGNQSNYYNKSEDINWTVLTNYPVACPEGSYVTQIEDSITCTVITEIPNNLTIIGNLSISNGTSITTHPTMYENENGTFIIKTSNGEFRFY